MGHSNERRRYFRVDDILFLHYSIEGEDGEHGARVEGTHPHLTNTRLLTDLDDELIHSIRRVWQDHPDVAQALGLLNRKLSVITRTMEALHADAPDYEEAQVNLSGSGIAFATDRKMDAGTRLALRIALKPSGEQVNLTGAVVNCAPLDENGAWVDDRPPGTSQEKGKGGEPSYWIRVDFDDAPEEQERLIQHVIQLQSVQLMESRQGA